MKKCTKCNISKSLDYFTKRKSNKDGLMYICKDCRRFQRQQLRLKNIEACREKDKEYYQKNKEKIKLEKKQYREENKEKLRTNRKSEENRKKRRIKKKIMKENNPLFKLRDRISNAIYQALKIKNGHKNKKSILKFLPYTIQELKYHLEFQFEPWMNWNNHGIYDNLNWDDNNPLTWKWQIDHIIPHSTFKYVSMESDDFKKCWALENLRPYSAKQNIMDGVSRIRHVGDL